MLGLILFISWPYIEKYLMMEKRHREIVSIIRQQELMGKNCVYVTEDDLKKFLELLK